MKKYLYIITGSALLIWSALMINWFWTDFPYLLTSFISQIRVLAVVLTLFVGVTYLYYGIKNEKINWAVDTSAWVLVVTLFISIIGMLFGCHRVGGSCTQSELLFQYVNNYFIPIGLIIAPIFLVVSFFLKRKY